MKKLSLIVSILREEFATFSSYSSFLRLLLFGFVKLAFGARGFETYIDEGDFTFIEAREL